LLTLAVTQALAAGQAPSAVYGAEHLLRLFVKLPELLPPTGEACFQIIKFSAVFFESVWRLFVKLPDLLLPTGEAL
jgi:hypothetical protein